jgi:hypothetical protein
VRRAIDGPRRAIPDAGAAGRVFALELGIHGRRELVLARYEGQISSTRRAWAVWLLVATTVALALLRCWLRGALSRGGRVVRETVQRRDRTSSCAPARPWTSSCGCGWRSSEASRPEPPLDLPLWASARARLPARRRSRHAVRGSRGRGTGRRWALAMHLFASALAREPEGEEGYVVNVYTETALAQAWRRLGADGGDARKVAQLRLGRLRLHDRRGALYSRFLREHADRMQPCSTSPLPGARAGRARAPAAEAGLRAQRRGQIDGDRCVTRRAAQVVVRVGRRSSPQLLQAQPRSAARCRASRLALAEAGRTEFR